MHCTIVIHISVPVGLLQEMQHGTVENSALKIGGSRSSVIS